MRQALRIATVVVALACSCAFSLGKLRAEEIDAQETDSQESDTFLLVSQEAQPPALQPPAPQTQGMQPGNQNQPQIPADRQFDPTLAAADTALRTAAAQQRLAQTPEMFGDFFGPQFHVDGEGGSFSLQIPSPGGGVTKVADSNKAAIGCRNYVFYNHFHNAMEVAELPIIGPPIVVRDHIDRITMGFERPIGQTDSSFELRVPFFADLDVNLSSGASVHTGEIGNIAGILKRELYRTEDSVFSVGLGTSLPTGGDTHADIGGGFVRIRNDAVHLLPFIAAQRNLDPFFIHAFVQLDVDLNGNLVSVDNGFDTGVVRNQTMLFVDLGMGKWFYRDPNAPMVTGLAGLFEVHYQTALEDADMVTLMAIGQDITFGGSPNRFDVVNLTGALQFDLGQRSSLRVGASAPVTQGTDRFFDAEFAVQWIIRCCPRNSSLDW